MTNREHRYLVGVEWTGNKGSGTSGYKAYERAHRIHVPGKPDLLGSSDPAFRGDPGRYNPEDLLVASLSSCHMLWYLHLAAVGGVVVVAYRDAAEGTMVEEADGGGRFVRVVLKPHVTIAPGSDAGLAGRLHDEAAAKCFVARSMNFPVEHAPVVEVAAE
jgi:organic hydroperoxide reductase OsmC/OhrA